MIEVDSSPIHEQIAYHLASKGTRLNWVAEHIQLSKPHFTNILKGKRKITPEILEKINNFLGTDFKTSDQEQVPAS